MNQAQKHVIIIGGGFGGISVAKQLRGKNIKVTLIDKSNHHLFQPLLYQVAAAALSPGDIATPIRRIVGKNSNINVLLGEVVSISSKESKIYLLDGREIAYDNLVIAVGARYNYFGHDSWSEYAPGLKSVSDALKIRERILLSLEEAEQMEDREARKPHLTYVLIGGGPTGVEMAGAIAEITKKDIQSDYRNISPKDSRIVLIEASNGILNGYPKPLPEKAKKMLKKMGIEIILGKPVTDIEKGKVFYEGGEIESYNIIWAAGIVANPIVKMLDAELDRNNRVIVKEDLSLPKHENIYVIGDAAHTKNKQGQALPSIAPVATQQGQFVGKLLAGRYTKGKDVFKYKDKGSMATIGKAKAVADIRGFKFSGFTAWMLWSVIHILYLIDFRNRFHVFIEWIWYYFAGKRGVRLITDRSSCEHCSIKDPQDKESVNVQGVKK